MNNTRFATAIHILVLLSKHKEEWIASEWLAGSIGVNPVVVRREIAALKKAGLVESLKGKDGGCRLAKKDKALLLSEVFTAISHTDLLGKKNKKPNPQCPVGKNINKELDKLYNQIDQTVVQYLKQYTLKEFTRKFG